MNRDDLCWFHGKITRENAEELIKQEGKEDGTFLVRESNTASGDFVLAVLHKGEVWQYQIRRHGEDAFFSIDDKVKILHGLDTLVQFYQQSANGLITRLTTHIKRDPPPNYSRSHGVTNLLHRATKENNQTVVSELLKCGYRNVDAKNQDGQTAVHLAALHCDESILKLLLDAGVNVNCMDSAGNMPLHYACSNKPASFIRILIDAHANVQGRNIKNGYVPLHEAAKCGNLDAVKELLAAHAPLLPRSSLGEFPIDLAKETGQDKVVEYLNNCKPPLVSTSKAQWYHGTLTREEASKALITFAAELKRKQLEKATVPEETPKCSGNNVEGNNEAAEQITKAENEEEKKQMAINTSGCFLVRYSERKTANSDYVLTLLWNETIKNFLIYQKSNHWYIDGGPYLPSLEHLIGHFMRFPDGLPTNLKHAVLPKPKPPLPLFSTMPRVCHMKSVDALLPSPTKEELSVRKHSLDAHKSSNYVVGGGGNMEKHAQTLTSPKKKHKENSNSMFNTLKKMRSPKKTFITDGMNSLIRNKNKNKSQAANEKDANKLNEDELQKATSVFKDLSFSTNFANVQTQLALNTTTDALPIPPKTATTPSPTPTATVIVPDDGFYNVPQNNTAVAADPSSSNTLYPIQIESKTEEEVEYFTKSDMAIELDNMNNEAEEILPPQYQTNANGYVPTVDIRVFLDSNADKESLEASAAQLREFSNHPERLDSMISTTSTESDIMRYLNRQNSTTSTITQCSEARPATPARFNYFIPRDCIQFANGSNNELDIIGEGEFGSVYKGYLVRRQHSNDASNNNNSEALPLRYEVAIKTLRDEHCRRTKQEFLREASVMIRLHHHCIVQLIGICKGETLMMIQELVPLGSMLQHILENKEKINPKHELKLWASQIACGMEYLESHHFVHRDLAARNILLASRNQAKISDFGLSRALGSHNDCYQASQGGKWPIKWYAPESFNNGLFSHASDVWSFGITLWEMFSLGEQPYADKCGVEAIALIESGQRLEQPPQCPDHVYEIMKNCWNYKAKDRPTFHYLTDFFARDPDYQNIVELIKTVHIS